MGTLKDMGWEGFSSKIWVHAREKRIPLSGTFELTPLCNLRCRMCYVRLDASDLPRYGHLYGAQEWLDLARQAAELGTYRITLTGGEALTRPDFKEIYTGLVNMGMLVTVLSNATLITEDTVRLFQEYKPSKLRFTLYGASNETYKRLCRSADGFDRAMRGIKLLKKGDVPFSLAFTETTENIDDLHDVLAIARDLGVHVAISNNIFPAVRGASSEAQSIRVEPKKQPSLSELDIDNNRIDPLTVLFNEQGVPDDFIRGPFAHCKSYRTSFYVDWNGRMDTCSFMSSSDVHPFEDGFQNAWNAMQERLSKLRLPETCRSCSLQALCPVCPGRREAETGVPDGIPCAICEDFRSRHESAINRV